MSHSQKVLVTNNEDSGWGPLNYALLLHPDILCTQSIVAEDKVINQDHPSPKTVPLAQMQEINTTTGSAGKYINQFILEESQN